MLFLSYINLPFSTSQTSSKAWEKRLNPYSRKSKFRLMYIATTFIFLKPTSTSSSCLLFWFEVSSLLESIIFYKALHLSHFESLLANKAISVEAKFCLKRSFLAFRMLKRSWLCLVVIKALPSSSLLFFIATKWCLVILECFLPLPVLYWSNTFS